MTRPCKCGECAFFKNEDANGYGHCIIKNGGAAGTGGRRIPLSSVRR